MPGTLFVVATPIGNLEDITARALRVLRQVALIAAEDTRRTGHLLARYAITTPTTSFHEHNEAAKIRSVMARLERGDEVALVSDAGTPTISDPGQRLVRAAIDAGIRVEPIPGASAAVTALAASGIAGQSFTFLGFPPSKGKDREAWMTELRNAGRTVVFYEAPHRIKETLSQIARLVGNRQVAVGRELTKTHEEFVRGPINTVIDELHNILGEFTVVIDIGQTTDIEPVEPPTDSEIADLFGQMTIVSGLPRRRVINQIAKRYGIPPNQIYDTIERVKRLGVTTEKTRP
ncbi:MAG: 16S rRNA (cytidine(1402)-2'-O)-methyltransferase [Acidobacteriota bacterium]